MDIKVMRAAPDTACTTTPYISASSSPQRLPTNSCYSAPASPTRISAFAFNWDNQNHHHHKSHSYLSTATSSNYGDAYDNDDQLEETDFAFDFSGQLERTTSTADELFYAGKIKPLTPPPRLHYDHQNKTPDSPKSPRSSLSPKNLIKQVFSHSPKKSHDFDPFAAALEKTQNENEERGRARTPSNSRHKKGARSLSSLKVSDLLIDPDEEPAKNNNNSSSSGNSFFSSIWYKRWKIKDLLLFRSASESRAMDKDDQIKKFGLTKRNHRREDRKSSSFRSVESVGSVSSRRRTGVSLTPHELHYTENRAVAEEMRKRTFLPYRHGFFGCLRFQPNVPQFPRTFDSSATFSRR